MPRYKFAFLHIDEIHHINHFITVAIELAKQHDVHILTFPGEHGYLYNLLNKLDGDNVVVEERPTLAFRAFTDKLKGRELPRKGFWLKKNSSYILDNFDGVIFTDFFHHELFRARKEIKKPKFFKFEHGAPGRSYSYREEQAEFDFQLLISEFHYSELKSRNLLGAYPIIAGYPKADAVVNKSGELLFSNKKPVVLYNPHFSEPLSSWHHWGTDILEYFYNQDKFNLVFAPHINLFKDKGGYNAEDIDPKYFEADDIYIDLASDKSVDMTYLFSSDIYLGDVSSQVYEFLLELRPCIFLNPTNAAFKDNVEFRAWRCGDVVNKLEDFGNILDKAKIKFETYQPIQREITDENFYDEENTTASERTALAMVCYLDEVL